MNKLFLLFGCFLLAACGPESNNDLPVASRKITYYNDGEREICRQEDLFDAQNRIIQTFIFGNRANDTISIINYYYSGDLLTGFTTSNNNGEIVETLINDYTLGTLTGELVIRGNDTITIKKFSYFDTGKLMREVTEYPKEKFNPITVVKYYDRFGNLEKKYNQIYEDSTKVVLSRYEMQTFSNKYDSLDNLIETAVTFLFGYYESADSISLTHYRYNESNKLTAQINTKKAANHNIDSIKYFYNEQDLLDYSIVYYASNKRAAPLTDTASYVYDTNNRIVQEKYSFKGNGFRYVYTK